MKNILLYILVSSSLFSCKKECTEPLGDIVQQEIEVAHFDKIIVNTGIELIIKDYATQSVVIETGENKLDNVSVSVTDKTLELQADDRCMLSISLDPVKVYIYSPDIKSIRNSSEYTISSDGVLTYHELILLTEDHDNGYLNIGNFDLELNNHRIKVVSNGISNIYLKGSTEHLDALYYSGIGRLEAKGLLAENVYFYHRAENSMLINPQQSLKGDLYSIGNVISYNIPPLVEVTEHYEGRLIYE